MKENAAASILLLEHESTNLKIDIIKIGNDSEKKWYISTADVS